MEKIEKKRSKSQESIEAIRQSLIKMEKSLKEKGANLKGVDLLVEEKINRYDTLMMEELERRERHMCEIIEKAVGQGKAGD